jgi:hypothetical protein
LSSADTKWNDLLRVLARLNDGTEKSDEELEKMNWNEKTKSYFCVFPHTHQVAPI